MLAVAGGELKSGKSEGEAQGGAVILLLRRPQSLDKRVEIGQSTFSLYIFHWNI